MYIHVFEYFYYIIVLHINLGTDYPKYLVSLRLASSGCYRPCRSTTHHVYMNRQLKSTIKRKVVATSTPLFVESTENYFLRRLHLAKMQLTCVL